MVIQNENGWLGADGKYYESAEEAQASFARDYRNYRKGVFISYSHKDKEWLERLQTVLKPLARNEEIKLWDDTRIPMGAMWERD